MSPFPVSKFVSGSVVKSTYFAWLVNVFPKASKDPPRIRLAHSLEYVGRPTRRSVKWAAKARGQAGKRAETITRNVAPASQLNPTASRETFHPESYFGIMISPSLQ